MAAETLTIRIDGDIKRAAKQRAEGLGLSLSTVLANQLRRFVNGEPVIIDDDSLVPSATTGAARAAAMADYRAGNITVLADADDIAAYDPEPRA
jgi:antitoxin component of RelBE/YafQ-DinJ toxin-antitoxin module